jgi:hypothetical protein
MYPFGVLEVVIAVLRAAVRGVHVGEANNEATGADASDASGVHAPDFGDARAASVGIVQAGAVVGVQTFNDKVRGEGARGIDGRGDVGSESHGGSVPFVVGGKGNQNHFGGSRRSSAEQRGFDVHTVVNHEEGAKRDSGGFKVAVMAETVNEDDIAGGRIGDDGFE